MKRFDWNFSQSVIRINTDPEMRDSSRTPPLNVVDFCLLDLIPLKVAGFSKSIVG